MQLANALKTLRRTQGAKNSIKAIEEYVRASPFYVGIPALELFLFGTSQANDGHAHVGSGETNDLFLLGVTSVRLVDDCLNFMSTGQFVMFHADATFKLSDLGYPVISCGFTDKKRSYQVAALFVVSRRTAADYAQCFGALARLFKEVRGRAIHIDAIMGDAADARANAYASIPEFARATILMCFFHVLYNVRKKVKHLSPSQRKTVFEGIVDMHFAKNMAELTRNRILTKWRSMPALQVFTKYFEQQWLTGRFWRWQAFHTPAGYATTNNPCEVYNSSLKSLFQRRRWHMKKLRENLRQHLDVQPAVEPVENSYVARPTTEVLDAASLLIQSRRVTVENTFSPACVRVCQVKSTTATATDDDDGYDSDSDDEAFAEIFETTSPAEDEDDVDESPSAFQTTSLAVASGDEWKENVCREREREKASKLYSCVVKWSLRRSHERGMPFDGWVVDVDRCICRSTTVIDEEAERRRLERRTQRQAFREWCQAYLDSRPLGGYIDSEGARILRRHLLRYMEEMGDDQDQDLHQLARDALDQVPVRRITRNMLERYQLVPRQVTTGQLYPAAAAGREYEYHALLRQRVNADDETEVLVLWRPTWEPIANVREADVRTMHDADRDARRTRRAARLASADEA